MLLIGCICLFHRPGPLGLQNQLGLQGAKLTERREPHRHGLECLGNKKKEPQSDHGLGQRREAMRGTQLTLEMVRKAWTEAGCSLRLSSIIVSAVLLAFIRAWSATMLCRGGGRTCE